MMQLAEARLTLEDKSLTKKWLRLSEEIRYAFIQQVEFEDAKRQCCAPYDCMCHEQCDGVGNECHKCATLRGLRRMTDDIDGGMYWYAMAMVEVGDDDIRREQFAHARDLESVGDYAAAERLLGAE